MRISDWSSDVCSSDLRSDHGQGAEEAVQCLHRLGPVLFGGAAAGLARRQVVVTVGRPVQADRRGEFVAGNLLGVAQGVAGALADQAGRAQRRQVRSEEHTSELQSLMRISYAVFCLKKKKNVTKNTNN